MRIALTTEPLLEASGVEKRFGATQALSGLDFVLRPGEIHALVGGNGAGKSTFIKVLAGIYESDGGTIRIADEPLEDTNRSWISFIHQDTALVPSMSVAENFGLVAGFPRTLGVVRERILKKKTKDALSSLGVDVDPSATVSDLSAADRAMVAIARSIQLPVKILVLDEPTANLPSADVERVWEIITRLAHLGTGIIYVTHRLKEVFEYCDTVTVVRDGRARAHTAPKSMSEGELAHLVAGSRLEAVENRSKARQPDLEDDPVIEFKDASTLSLAGVSFGVSRGQVVALTGLRGAGQDELAEWVFGLRPGTGVIAIDKKPIAISTPADALAAGIAYVSGDRSLTVARELTVTENILMNPRYTRARGWVTRSRRERPIVQAAVAQFGIVPGDPNIPVGALSGGNAQKVVLARSDQADPRVMVLHEPTAGVDVGARADFYEVVRQRCAQGAAALLVSSDYEEVETLADIVHVLVDGVVVSTLVGRDITEARIAQEAMGMTQ